VRVLGRPWTMTLRSPGGVVISTFAWIAIGVAAWLAVAVLVGVLIGRMIRGRDRQIPVNPPPPPGDGPRIPAQGTAAHPAGPPARREPDAPPRS
jgi:hypothetical protein